MTTLAVMPGDGLFGGLSTPTAGREATSLKKALWTELGRLRAVVARTSGAFNELESLAREHGTSIPRNAAFLAAQGLLMALPSDIPAPEFDVDSDGDIVLDWVNCGSKMLTIAISEHGRIHYAARLSATKSRNGSDIFVDAISREILDLVRAVTRR
jgi:hypothetical protein